LSASRFSLSSIEKLRPDHDTSRFDCGDEALDRFLKRFALVSQRADGTQTYVACRDGGVVAYYSLAVGGVEHDDAPERLGKGLARHPIPVMILARLAVTKAEKGKGIGKGLLKDALQRTAQAADIAGIRAIIVHAKDDDARAFYLRFDFDLSPTDPNHLFLLLKDVRRHLT
jgi:GNAT superfamily N-acetyltransferase